MPYSNFSFERVNELLELDIQDTQGLFDDVEEYKLPEEFVHRLLEDNVPLALAINNEKVRSELIIAPVLMEVWKIEQRRISLMCEKGLHCAECNQ